MDRLMVHPINIFLRFLAAQAEDLLVTAVSMTRIDLVQENLQTDMVVQVVLVRTEVQEILEMEMDILLAKGRPQGPTILEMQAKDQVSFKKMDLEVLLMDHPTLICHQIPILVDRVILEMVTNREVLALEVLKSAMMDLAMVNHLVLLDHLEVEIH